MIIRHATLADCRALYRLSKAPGLIGPWGTPPPLRWYQSFVRAKQVVLVAVEGTQTVGFTLAERTTGSGAIVHMVAVAPKHQRQGIGTQLLIATERELKRRGAYAIILYGFARNRRMITALQKHGYHRGGLYYEFVKLGR